MGSISVHKVQGERDKQAHTHIYNYRRQKESPFDLMHISEDKRKNLEYIIIMQHLKNSPVD